MSFETAAFWGMGAVLAFGVVALVMGLLSRSDTPKGTTPERHAHS